MRNFLKGILSIIICFTVAYAGEKRGGGSKREILVMQGVAPTFFEQHNEIKKSTKEYIDQFCFAARTGIKLLQKKSETQHLDFNLIEEKISKICSVDDLIKINENLFDENGHELTAVNWPESSRIEINPKRWDNIEGYFNSHVQQLLYQVIAAHEVLSLMDYEESHNYKWSSLLLKESEYFSKMQSQNELEQIVGTQALLFEMDNSSQSQLAGSNMGLFSGMVVNHLRHQLLSFSPLFDKEVKANTNINYINEYNERISNRGSSYILGYNKYLLKSIISKQTDYFKMLGVTLIFSDQETEYWSVAVQLHQLYLALLERKNILHGYELKVSRNAYLNPFDSTLDIDINRKTASLNISTKMDSIAGSLSNNYTYKVHERKVFLNQESTYPSIGFTQNWPEITIGQTTSIASIMMNSENYEFFPFNPIYLGTFLISGTSFPWKKSNSGLLTKTKIIKIFNQRVF